MSEDVVNNYLAGKYNLDNLNTPAFPKPSKEILDYYKKANTPTPSLGSDLVSSFKSGGATTLAGLANTGNKLGIVPDTVSKDFIKSQEDYSNKQISSRSKEFNKKRSIPFFDENNNFHPEAINAPHILGAIAETAPAIAATVAGTAALSTLGAPVAGAVGLGRIGAGVAEALPSVARFAEALPGTASAATKLNKLVGTSIAEGTSEGLVTAGQDSNQTRNEALNTPLESYRNNPKFQEELANIDPSLPQDQREQLARSNLAKKASDDVFKSTFASTAGIGLLTGGGAIGGLQRAISKGTGPVTSSLIKKLGTGAAEEMFQEIPQSAAEQYLQNAATKEYINPNKNLSDGVLNAAAEGGVVGGLSGGAIGGVSHLVSDNISPTNVVKPPEVSNINPLTGTEYQNSDIKDIYNHYNQSATVNQDITSEAYKNSYQAAKSSLDNIINSNKEIDPIKLQEAKDTLDFIDKSHNALVSINNRESTDSANKQDLGKAIADSGNQEIKATENIISTNEDLSNKVEDLQSQGLSKEEALNSVTPEIQETISNNQELDNIISSERTNPIVSESTKKEIDRRNNSQLRRDYNDLQSRRKSNEVQLLKEKVNSLNQELNTNHVSNIPNKRAFLEKDISPVVASIDIDSLKFINDNLGHAAGDQLLKTVASVLAKYVDAFHVSGDELVARGTTKEELQAGLEAAQKELQSGKYTIEEKDVGSFNKPSFSYGISETAPFTDLPKEEVLKSSLKAADLNMLLHKQSREVSGERAGRGMLPKGMILKESASLSPIEQDIKTSLNSQDSQIDSELSLDSSSNLSSNEVDTLKVEVNKNNISPTPEQNSYLNNLKSEQSSLRSLKKAGKEYDASRLKDITSKINSLSPKKKINTINNVKSFTGDTTTQLEPNGDVTELLSTTDQEYGILDLSKEYRSEVIDKELKFTFNKLVSNLKSFTKEDLEFYYISDFSKHDWSKEGITPSKELKTRARGLHSVSKETGLSRIYINGALANSKEDLAKTWAHEVIGHYGVRRVLGNSTDKVFIKMLNNRDGGKLRNDILSLVPRWEIYLRQWNAANDINSLSQDQKILFDINRNGKISKEYIPIDVAIRLTDEYMAELAKEKFLDSKFIQNEVGLGVENNYKRSSLRRDRERWLNQFITQVKHLLKKVFGDSLDTLTHDDLTKIIAQSIDTLFEVVNTDHIIPSNYINSGIYNSVNVPYQGKDSISTDDLSYSLTEDQLSPEDIKNEFVVSPISDLNGFIEGINSPLGNHTSNVRNRLWGDLTKKFQESPLLSVMGTFGNMPYQEAYKALENISLGQITKVESYTKAISSSFDGMNPLQLQAAREYFITKGANVEDVPITPIQKKALQNAKLAIRELGRSLAQSGVIDQETFDKNEDAYLHVMYLKYIDQYRGTGKKTSFLSWARSKKDLSEKEKLALGEIKNVKFLVPETLGILARDHVLLNMFNTINKASIDNKLFWTLTTEDKVSYLGKKLTIDQAYEQIEQSRFILSTYKTDKEDTFFNGTTEEITSQYNTLKEITDKLQTDTKTLEDTILKAAHEHALKTNQTSSQDYNEFLKEKYVQLPNYKQLGALRNKWVRKEIASDLNALTNNYDLTGRDWLDKFIAPNGTLERFHRFWKRMMVGYNPGSWARNTLGNFALLDLSTSTNKFKLISMLHEEASEYINFKPSKFFELAREYGLFGSTFSAVELQELHNEFAEDLKKAKASYEARTNSSIDKHLHFLDERLMSFANIAANKTAKHYALLEGLFKTVAMRDYIQIWESQNNTSIDNISKEQQQIIYSKAAKHANDSLFDYSQVNRFIKTLRRVPFGSPFITFSYKAIPASFRAMINHPIKFAEYATLPALLTMLAQAANDWDDDDIVKMKKSLPEYYRLNPGIAFFPIKDSLNRPQIIPLDYILPWGQLAIAARKTFENYVEDGGESPISTSLKSVGTIANEFGFLGGPAPSAMAAMISGKDDFTGKDITTPGASASTQLGEIMSFAYNMSVPAWIGSNGWFSKMYQAFGDHPETNAFGDIKYTPGQAIGDITGFRTIGVNEKSGLKGRKLGYETRLKDIALLRTKVIKDRSKSQLDKVSELKDIAQREKMVRTQMKDTLTGT